MWKIPDQCTEAIYVHSIFPEFVCWHYFCLQTAKETCARSNSNFWRADQYTCIHTHMWVHAYNICLYTHVYTTENVVQFICWGIPPISWTHGILSQDLIPFQSFSGAVPQAAICSPFTSIQKVELSETLATCLLWCLRSKQAGRAGHFTQCTPSNKWFWKPNPTESEKCVNFLTSGLIWNMQTRSLVHAPLPYW